MEIIHSIDWNSIALVFLGAIIAQGFYSFQQWRKRLSDKRRLLNLLKIELQKGIDKTGSHVPVMITSTLIHESLDPKKDLDLIKELLCYWVLAEDYKQSVFHMGEGLDEELSTQAKNVIEVLNKLGVSK